MIPPASVEVLPELNNAIWSNWESWTTIGAICRLIPRRSFGIRSDWSVGVGKTTCDMEITDAREVDLCCGGGDLLRGRK